MRTWVGSAVLAALGAVAAGCMGGGGHHPTLSASDALAQARSEGFVRSVRAKQPPTYLCAEHQFQVGSSTSGRDAGYTRPSYQLAVNNPRRHAGPGNAPRSAMLITVFPDAATARRCADAGVYLDLHPPPVGNNASIPRRQIDPTTIVINEHPPGAPGSLPGETGEYDIFLANGRVFAQGLAGNAADAKIVREDLERLAAEIAG